MCRLFAVHSSKPIATLAAPFAKLNGLSAKHNDGWGLATFNGDRWTLEHSAEAASESSRFAQLGLGPKANVALAHLRLATVGVNAIENNHPFESNGWVFMHNGTLENFEANRARLEAAIAPPFRSALMGTTDSERLFALYLTEIDGRVDVDAVEASRALSRVAQLASSICDEPGGAKSKLNVVASNGSVTLAMRNGHTLFTSDARNALSIASEPMFPGEWHEVPEGGLVSIDQHLNRQDSLVVDWR